MENTLLDSSATVKILPDCTQLPHSEAASCPMDMKCTQCPALCGVKSAEGLWAVEKDEGLVLSWGTEFAGKEVLSYFHAINVRKKDKEKSIALTGRDTI